MKKIQEKSQKARESARKKHERYKQNEVKKDNKNNETPLANAERTQSERNAKLETLDTPPNGGEKSTPPEPHYLGFCDIRNIGYENIQNDELEAWLKKHCPDIPPETMFEAYKAHTQTKKRSNIIGDHENGFKTWAIREAKYKQRDDAKNPNINRHSGFDGRNYEKSDTEGQI